MNVKLIDEKCKLRSGSKEAGGIDICVRESRTIQPHETVLIPSGIALEIPVGCVGHIVPRSSSFKKGLNISGVIDSDYRGEVQIMINNTTTEDITIEAYTYPAQILVEILAGLTVTYVDQLSETARGSKGFGSSGA